MRALAFFVFLACASWTIAQQRPPEIDPNTKTEGGADVRKSGAAAGATTRDEKSDAAAEAPQQREQAGKDSKQQDKPTSERKPREREEPSQDSSAPPGSSRGDR